jgi:hypothetical protein
VTLHELPDLLLRGMAVFLVGLAIGLVATHTLLVALAAQRSSLARSQRVIVTGLVGTYLIAWLSVAITLGDRTNFPLDREALRLPISGLVAFGPMFLGIAGLFMLNTLRGVNAAMPAMWLIGVQTYRIAGLIFLFPYLYYRIVPASFAIPAGVGDFVTGALAPFVAFAVAHRRPHAIMWATMWNLFGIVDLLVAPVAAVLSHAQLIGRYPLSLVPLFIGPPMGILAHVYSMRNLRVSASSISSDTSSTSVARRRPIENALGTVYPRTRGRTDVVV